MKIGGQWVGLGLGDSGPEIKKIKELLRRKFSYASGLDSTTLFDQRLSDVVVEMQSRYERAGKLDPKDYIPGVVNVATKVVMGLIPPPAPADERPVLFTVCGTGVPWWVGPDADVARMVEDRYLWQPIGYPARPFPMRPSVEAGRDELAVQFEKHRDRVVRHGAALIGYSQGAIVTCESWMDEINYPGGRLSWAAPHVRKAVTFGNPMRQKGKVWADAGGRAPHPDSHGIADRLMTDTPEWWRDYAHAGDLYTDVSGESAENKTAIYKVVMGSRVFSGPDSLLRQVLELTGVVRDSHQIIEVTALMKAIMDAGLFFVKGTGPHINYSTAEAVAYLRSMP